MRKFGIYLLSFLPILCIGTLVKSLAFQLLWEWFLLPTIHIVTPRLSLCFGIILIFVLIRNGEPAKVPVKMTVIVDPLVILAVGWIVHFFFA